MDLANCFAPAYASGHSHGTAMRILVVEDYAPVRDAVAGALREADFAVDTASDGEVGLWSAQSGPYDVIVLDIALPKLDGLHVLQSLRRHGDRTPVLLLTARDTVADRVTGLDTGADDYLVKPFSLQELLARVRALVRRNYDGADPAIRIQDLEVNTTSRTVHRGGRRIDLTAREYALLEYLAHRAGQIVTRTDIWEHVYDFRSTVESNVVDVYIGYLRRKIEIAGLPRLIQTRRGQGYVLE
ncbi:MAG: response regulator transcription factor [Phycisphaerales bacterium]|nr:response regulator transcription factor [Phycisphaerales bacterium]